MSKKTVTKRKKKIYEIVEMKGRATRPETSIERLTRQENDQLVRDAERLNLETIIAERKARLATAKSGLGLNPGGSKERIELSKALITNPQVQKEWLALDDASRAILMASANQLSQQGQSFNSIANNLPLMLMTMRQNPRTTVQELVALINVIKPAQTGKNETAELIRALTPLFQQQQGSKGGVVEAIATLTPIFNAMASKDQALYLAQLRRLEDQIVNPADMLKSIVSGAESIGFSRGSSNLEIEKLKSDTAFKLQQMNFNHQKWRDEADLKKMAERDKWTTIKSIGVDWMGKIAPIIDAGVESTQKRIRQGPTQRPPGSVEIATESGNIVPCVKCGFRMPIEGEPETLVCPSCGEVHRKNIELHQPTKMKAVKVVKDVKKNVEK